MNRDPASRQPNPRAGRPVPTRRSSRPLAVAVLATALALAGCGGGGGGGAVDTAPLPVFVDGAVTKGPVAGARVCGVWTVAGVADASTQTCADTGSDGKYALQMPRRTGLLVVTATGGSYRDEATGATVSMGTLRSATAFDGVGNNVTAQVSAVTEVLVRRAQARGPLDETTVAAASTEVRRTFGVSDPLRTRPADVTTRDANVAGTSELLYGLSNAGVVGWMAERGIASLDEGLAALSAKIASGTLYDELAAYRAGIKRVIVSNPASGLNLNASAYSTMVSLDFGTPPPAPTRPPIVEQAGTQRFTVKWAFPWDALIAGAPVCVTNVPSAVPVATVRAAMQAHAGSYTTQVTAMTPVAACLGGGQTMTIDWSRTSADPWGTAIWGDEG